MKYTPYSFSKLSTSAQCPRKFKYAYITKPPKNKKDMTALLKGRAVHDILEKYPEQSSHKLAEKYKNITDTFITSGLGKKYLSVKSIREYQFGLTKDLSPGTYNDKSILFRGKIDHICILNNTLHLCDWKTGKYKDERYQDYIQLLFYSIYFFQKYPKINEIKISFVYIEHCIENVMTLNRKYLFNYVKMLIQMIKNTENIINFNKNTTKLCNWCDWKDYCFND